MLADPQHPAHIVGSVTAPALALQPLTVTAGAFNLFVVDGQHPNTRRMRYRMTLTAEDGRRYFFDGFKLIHDDPGFDLWTDTTTLFITIHQSDEAGPVCGKGVLTISPADFAKQLTTVQITNAAHIMERLKALARFGRFFAGALYDTYVVSHK
jgi:cholesterol oxidase